MMRRLLLLAPMLLAACGHDTPLNGNDQQPVVNQTVPEAPPSGQIPAEKAQSGGSMSGGGDGQSGQQGPDGSGQSSPGAGGDAASGGAASGVGGG